MAFLKGKAVSAGLILLSTVVSLLLGELLARFVVNPGDFLLATVIADPVLGHRVEPHTSGHDALGFRNPKVPERARVVAIGDSQTYGIAAVRSANWPNQLGILLGQPVYNMALGGYGPLDYLYLADHEASKLRPQLLLVGFYFGNDLLDAYAVAHHRPYWRDWAEALSEDPGETQDPPFRNGEQEKLFLPDVRDWLSHHSLVYALLKVTLLPRFGLWEKDRIALQTTPDDRMIWIDPSAHAVRTIFTPQVRLSALDPQLPSVREGLRITKRAFASLKTQTDAQGMSLVLVLIPTKERVYCHYLKETDQHMPEAFVRLCDAEERVKNDLIQFLAARKVSYVEVTGAMEEQVRNHVQLYPMDSDGHPRAAGYSAIARGVYDALHRR